MATGHERSSAGRTPRGRMEVCQANAAVGKSIDMGSLVLIASKAPQIAIAKIIGHDVDDVRLICSHAERYGDKKGEQYRLHLGTMKAWANFELNPNDSRSPSQAEFPRISDVIMRLLTTLMASWSALAVQAWAEESEEFLWERFEIAGRPAFVILPDAEQRRAKTPWVFYAPTFDRRLPSPKDEGWMIRQFLDQGIAIAGADVGESYGSPAGRDVYSALYEKLVSDYHFDTKACLLARSRGGLMLYNWAADHPDKVRCIAGIYPVCNLQSYPGLAKACEAYGLTESQLEAGLSIHNPINRLAPLAEANVPIHHIHGDVDKVVPSSANSEIVAKRYRELGKSMTLEVANGQGHNMWEGFFKSQALVDFVISHAVIPKNPNILFVLIDDLGWMDLHVQGNAAVHTPNIDRLAAEGMRFTDNYAAAPVCSPTRAAILTGLSPARLAITNHLPEQARFIPDNPKVLPARTLDHLPLEHVTIAERLKEAGYATGFIGKWHLSGPGKGKPEFEPTAQGFDINIGGCGYGGPPTFFDPYRIPNLEPRRKGEYLPERLADEALSFMKTQKEAGDPFMLFLWNYTVHWPMEAPKDLLEKYASHNGPGLNDPRYGAMIEAMDQSIGRVLKGIDEMGLREETIVIFTSDNGGFGGVADNRPLREEKGYLYEGGLRVPMMVRWPGKIEPGVVSSEPVVSMDLYPTLLEAAGLEIPDKLDGESLMPVFDGTGKLQRDSLFFHYPNYAFHRGNRLGSAMRQGPYKLIENFDDGSLELYQLEDDLSETKNLAESEPEKASLMAARLRAWRDSSGARLPVQVEGDNQTTRQPDN